MLCGYSINSDINCIHVLLLLRSRLLFQSTNQPYSHPPEFSRPLLKVRLKDAISFIRNRNT